MRVDRQVRAHRESSDLHVHRKPEVLQRRRREVDQDVPEDRRAEADGHRRQGAEAQRGELFLSLVANVINVYCRNFDSRKFRRKF